jgi:hypothetical protein
VGIIRLQERIGELEGFIEQLLHSTTWDQVLGVEWLDHLDVETRELLVLEIRAYIRQNRPL